MGIIEHKGAFFEDQTMCNNNLAMCRNAEASARGTIRLNQITPHTQVQEMLVQPRVLFHAEGQNSTPCATHKTKGGAVLAMLIGEIIANDVSKMREMFLWQPEFGSSKRAEFIEKARMG